MPHSETSRPRVVIAYKSLPRYRVTFFDSLRTELDKHGVLLDLAYGGALAADAPKRDGGDLPWAIHRTNREVRLGGRSLVWQPIDTLLRGADLVVVEQASKLLVNYWLLARQLTRTGPHVAFWGHGANLQSHTASRFSEALKRHYSKLPFWWFAYTDGVRERVAALGYPRERITVVQNAIDTAGLRADIEEISSGELGSFRARHGLTEGSTGLFIGSLYQEKRLPFLIEAAQRIHERVPDFVLLVAGDGPSRGLVEAAAQRHKFIRPVGRVDGSARALVLRAADLVLMPGLVGLAILDAFAAGAPIVTSRIDYHSPEIEYLREGDNGVCAPDPNDSEAYADVVVGLLLDRPRRMSMSEGARRSSERYTNEAMVRRFTSGVLSALSER